MRKYTNQQAEILLWANKQGAHPVERAPFRPDGEPAQLGFVFGDAPEAEEHLQPIAWTRFFAVFHLMGLVLAYEGGKEYELMKVDGRESGWIEGKPLPA